MILADPDEPLDSVGEGDRDVDVGPSRLEGLAEVWGSAVEAGAERSGVSGDGFEVERCEQVFDLWMNMGWRPLVLTFCSLSSILRPRSVLPTQA